MQTISVLFRQSFVYIPPRGIYTGGGIQTISVLFRQSFVYIPPRGIYTGGGDVNNISAT